MIPEIIKTLSHKNLAKVLTLIELEKRIKEKRISGLPEKRREDKKIFGMPDTFIKLHSLYTFFKLLSPNVVWTENDYNSGRNIIKIISEYANAEYDEWNILSSLFNSINQTKTKIDSMIVHRSHEGTLKKLIIIECKTGNSPLTKNQKAFADCIKRMKSDKVEYKVINIDYQVPEQLALIEK